MNKITVVADKLIYKRFKLSEKCTHEFEAWKQFNEIIPQNTPTLILRTNNLCIYEFLESDSKLVSKQEASEFAGKVISNIFHAYKPNTYKKGQMWELSVYKIIEDFSQHEIKLKNIGLENFYFYTINQLRKIKKIKFSNISFLHRDIHRGNILCENGQPYLIDHEHAMEGPIELELQNSIFWNDKMSLNVDKVKKILTNNNIPYSSSNEILLKNYYVADQINIAIKENKFSKVKKLASKNDPAILY
ncbi:hypothetical protein GYA27_01470 [candidate division WWE3 bacterium]|uniref:Aminoglycoside phosphotransferase domain-containing protein n=1 Tax=candidate division WWE3 bacterium TaxID=2053526 RepID=A0A7X9DK06_UNCKA|nr:hypothetical protein [candidate division WWE3 bacterium]